MSFTTFDRKCFLVRRTVNSIPQYWSCLFFFTTKYFSSFEAENYVSNLNEWKKEANTSSAQGSIWNVLLCIQILPASHGFGFCAFRYYLLVRVLGFLRLCAFRYYLLAMGLGFLRLCAFRYYLLAMGLGFLRLCAFRYYLLAMGLGFLRLCAFRYYLLAMGLGFVHSDITW